MEITVEKVNDVAVVAMRVAELDAANAANAAEFERDFPNESECLTPF